MEPFGCWKAALSALGNTSLGNCPPGAAKGPLGRPQPALPQPVGVRACMYTAAADARVCAA